MRGARVELRVARAPLGLALALVGLVVAREAWTPLQLGQIERALALLDAEQSAKAVERAKLEESASGAPAPPPTALEAIQAADNPDEEGLAASAGSKDELRLAEREILQGRSRGTRAAPPRRVPTRSR